MWVIETAWPPIIILIVLSIVFLSRWKETGKKSTLVTAIVLLLTLPVIYLIEINIVTEKEKLEKLVYDFTYHFQQKHLDETLSYIAKKDLVDQFRIKNSFKIIDVEDDLRITDIRVTLSELEPLAKTHFRANASLSFRNQSLGYRPSRWNVYWQKKNDQWKVIQIDRLDPIKGTNIKIPVSTHSGIFKDKKDDNELPNKFNLFGS